MATRVKICGITNTDDALAAAKMGADFLGFVFSKSPRRIEPDNAAEIISLLPASIAKVGLFVDESESLVRELSDRLDLDYIQLHGDEDPDYCNRLRQGRGVIKAFRIEDEASLNELKNYNVDMYLVDSFSRDKKGGTGIVFDWDLAARAKEYGRSVILAGGLTPENVGDAIRKVRPYAVDVSSGVEERPGKKDHSLMEAFISEVRKAQY